MKLVLTNDIDRACQQAEPDELLFFISDSREAQDRVRATEPSAIIVVDGLDHFPRIIADAVRTRIRAKRLLGPPVSD